MASATPLVVHPSRRSRRWVHAVPVVVAVAVLVIPVIAGAVAFTDAAGDSGTAPAAPMAGLLVWMVWMFPLSAVGTFVTLLAYLVVRPSPSPGLFATQIVFTSLAAMVAFFVVLMTVHLLLSLQL